MQNAQTSLADDDYNLDLAQGPTSLTSLPETTTLKELAPSPPGEAVQSDTEIRPKVKGRSRFSTAIRKLSGSTRKKQQQSQKDSTGEKASTAGSTVAETTSGSEKLSTLSRNEDEKEKEKEKLKEKDKGKEAERDKVKVKEKEKGQGQGQGLEKAKDKEKEKLKEKEKEKEKEKLKDQEKEKEQEKEKDQQKTKKKSRLSKKFLLPALKKSKISPKTNIDESENDEVIEISPDTSKSAKQSRVQITISGKKVEQPLASPEADYLTLSEDTQQNPNEKVIEPTTVEPSKVKKKLKPKKTASSCTRTPSEEKLVITQSIRDAPPSEKAPLKPSRSLAGASQQPIESTETFIRKPTVSTTAPILSSSIAQRFIGGGTGSSPKQPFGVGDGVKTASVEADLMQTPSSSLQRGHRLPRPSSTTTTTTTTEPSTTAITPSSTSSSLSPSSLKIVTPAEPTHFTELSPQLQQQLQQQRQKQRQIQFQLQSESSHASQSLPQPSSDGGIVSSEIASPTYPRPPVPIGRVVTPQSRSIQFHQQHTIPYADESVATANSNVADELPSSAESVGHHEQDYDAEVASYLGAVNKDSERLPRQGTTTSADSIKSSGSQSPHSESSRKRIHYVAQPTLYDETVNRRQRSDDFKLTTEAREHIFEADSTDSGDKQMPAFGDLAMDEEMEPTIMTTANAEKREHLYKILVIGELGTGKTSFIKRYVHQFFSQNYRATIGVDFALKVLHWDPNTIVRLQLWDIAGQERFGNMTRVYYKEAVGAFIVFDVTRSGTFECVSKWKEDLDSKVQLPDGSPIPCILLANKCDQEKQGIVTQTEKMDEYVKENGFSGWFETSAKENTNIDEAARALVSKILLNDKLISAADLADSEKFNLNNAADQADLESKKCSC